MAAAALSPAAVGAAVGLIGQVVDALAAIPAKVRDFVDAFNPNAGRQLDFAFRSLEATIGYALEPVIGSFTALFRTLASEFNGGLTELRDVVGGVSDSLSKILQPVIRLLAVGFEGVAGIFKSAAPILDVFFAHLEGDALLLGAALQIVTAVLAEMIKANLAFAAGLLGLDDVAASTTDAFVSLTVTVVKATDKFLRLIGAFSLADKILDTFTRKPPPGRAEGMKDQRITGLEDVYKARLLEAAKAYGGGNKEKSALDLAAEQLKLYQQGLNKQDDQKKVLEEIRDRMPRTGQAAATLGRGVNKFAAGASSAAQLAGRGVDEVVRQALNAFGLG